MENNNCGQIKISNEVVSTIAWIAALEVEGVESSQSIADKLLKNNGVKIQLEEEVVTVDIMVVVKFGFAIPDVAFKVQENVKNAVETMTGLDVSQVNRHVQGVSFKKDKEEAKKKYQKPLDTYHGIVVVDIPQSFAEVKKDTAQFTISGWSLSDCLNDRLKVTFDDQEVTEMRKINRSDVLMAYQEKYGGYGTNDDECGFDYFVDVSQMELGEHSILVQLLDEKDKVISEKDLKINII